MRIVLLETEQRHSLLHGAKKKKKKTSMILCSTAVWKAGLIIDEMKSLGVQLRRFPAIC